MEFCSREPTGMMTPSLAGVENRLEHAVAARLPGLPPVGPLGHGTHVDGVHCLMQEP